MSTFHHDTSHNHDPGTTYSGTATDSTGGNAQVNSLVSGNATVTTPGSASGLAIHRGVGTVPTGIWGAVPGGCGWNTGRAR